jgi:hypothetical protein
MTTAIHISKRYASVGITVSTFAPFPPRKRFIGYIQIAALPGADVVNFDICV